MNKLRSLVFAAFLALPLASFAEVQFSVGWAPPPLPVVEQPACPAPGYIWTPGYWGWDDYYYDYYWVPGVWVAPPRVGLLWTPGWWGWRGGSYAFNQGYWGPTVGFYGGVNYGYGYTGNGYWGGRWSGNTFEYNTAVTRVNKTVINNTYVNNNFAKNVNASRTSFNGPNGIKAQPNAQQKAAMANARKEGPTSQQLERQKLASKDQNLRASVNKGKPNQEAIKSFNKTEGAGQGRGGQEVGAAGGAGAGNKPGNLSERQGQGTAAGAGAGQGENKPGNMAERNRPGERVGQGQGKGVGAGGAAQAGQGENKPGKMAEHRGQGEGLNAEERGNKLKTGNQANAGNMGGNQAKMRSGQQGGPAHGQHAMNQQMSRNARMSGNNPQMKSGQQQMRARNAQMGGKHPQMGGGGKRPQMGGGGNRPKPSGQQQQQGKKKGKPDR